MYDTSNEYKEAIKKENRETDLEITITSNKGYRYTLGRNEIIKNSFSISHQCCSNTEIEIGSVYSAELSVTIISDINRYTLSKGTIEPVFKLKTSNGWESIPLGIFQINEANKKISCIEILANDNMINFEKSFSNTNTIGKPYDFLVLCCESCGIELSQTKQQIEAMPNGKTSFSIYEDNDIETYRDVIYYVAQILGGVATITRDGKLSIRQYGNTVVSTIKGKHRFSSDFSDFITRYSAVSSTNVRTNISEYEALDQDDQLTMVLGVNPLLQYGTDETRKKALQNILQAISVIEYVPFSASILCDPSLDLCDCIRFEDLHADAEHISCITGYAFTFNGEYTISCYGKNPLLAQAKSKNEKNIQGLLNQSAKNEVIIYNFTNAKEINIAQTKTEIISIAYVTKNKTSAEFNANVLYELTNDGNALVSFVYEVDSNEITTHVPKSMKLPGLAFDTLYYPLIDVKEESVHTFRVYMMTDSGTINIDRFGIVAAIRGQGLVSSVIPWDGKIECDDILNENITINSNLSFTNFVDEFSSINMQNPLSGLLNDTFGIIEINSSLSVNTFIDHFGISPVIEKNTIDITCSNNMIYSDRYVIIKDKSFVLQNEFEFVSVNQPIDQGILRVVSIDSSVFKTIKSIYEE